MAVRDRIVELRRVPASELRPNPRNWRRHPSTQANALRSILEEVGYADALLARETPDGLELIDGHLRAETTPDETVPVLVLDVDEAEAALILATLDPLASMAIADTASLEDLLDSVEIPAPDLLKILEGIATAVETWEPTADEELTPTPPADPVTQPGNIWNLGRHRLVCGDAASGEDVSTLLAGRTVNLAFTSPPYADRRVYDESSPFRPIHPDQYVTWFAPIAKNVRDHLAADGSWFINIKPTAEGIDTSLYVFDLVIAHVREWGWHFATEFCWERLGVPKNVTRRFKNQFEPIYQFALGDWKMRPDAVRHESDHVPRARGPGVGNTGWHDAQGNMTKMHAGNIGFGSARAGPGVKQRRNGTAEFMSDVQGKAHDVGEYIGPGLAYPGNRLPTFVGSHDATGHTAAFPVGLPEFFIRAYTDEADAVYDPFAGSGSTLIASERTGRTGFAMEISPAYCDVIVARWEQFTGQTAQRENDADAVEVHA